MINVERENNIIVTVDRIEGEYAVCLMPDFTTKDLKLSKGPIIRENDRLEVKYNENMELEFIRFVEKTKKRKIPARLIRFR